MLWGFVLPGVEYGSAVWCSAADTHFKLLERVVTGASFITGGVFECNIAHLRFMAVLCMLYRSGVTRCTHFLVHYMCHHVPVQVKRIGLVVHWYTYTRAMPLSVTLWNDLSDPVFDGERLP